MERTISPHIKDRFKLVGIQPGEVVINGVKHDFRTITAAEADKLYLAGYPRLKPVSEEVKKQLSTLPPSGGTKGGEKKAITTKRAHSVEELIASSKPKPEESKTKKSK